MVRKSKTCGEASLGSVDYRMFKLWSSGAGWGHNGG